MSGGQKKKQLQGIATTSTSLEELKTKAVKLRQKDNQIVATWQQHFNSVTRIENSLITKDSGLAERRLFQLKFTQKEKSLVIMVSLQIQDLLDFFGFKNTMNANQILDTAEFIVQDFDNFSIRAIQHCFNMLKKGEPPYNTELYNTLNGAKILRFLKKYDEYIDDYLFSESNKKAEHDKIRAFTRTDIENSISKLGNLSAGFNAIKKRNKKLK